MGRGVRRWGEGVGEREEIRVRKGVEETVEREEGEEGLLRMREEEEEEEERVEVKELFS